MARFSGFQLYEVNDPYHFLLQLGFASAWGFWRGLSFNGLVWSASAEIGAYALFLLYLRTVPVTRVTALGAVLAALALHAALSSTLSYAVLCFFLGALVRGLLLIAARARAGLCWRCRPGPRGCTCSSGPAPQEPRMAGPLRCAGSAVAGRRVVGAGAPQESVPLAEKDQLFQLSASYAGDDRGAASRWRSGTDDDSLGTGLADAGLLGAGARPRASVISIFRAAATRLATTVAEGRQNDCHELETVFLPAPWRSGPVAPVREAAIGCRQ